MVALFAEYAPALLLSFLHGDADAGHLAACLVHQVYEGVHGLTVGKEVIDYQHAVRGLQVGLGDKHVVHLLVGERIGLRHVLVVGAVCRLALLGKHHGHVIHIAQHGGNGNAARLDGEHFVYCHIAKAPLQLVGYLAHDVNVNLMVQEVVYLQDITLLDITVG